MKVFRAISATTAADVVGRCRSLSFFLSFTLTLSLFFSLAFPLLSSSLSLISYIEIVYAFSRLPDRYSVGTTLFSFVLYSI